MIQKPMETSFSLVPYGESGLVCLRDKRKELAAITRKIRMEASVAAPIYRAVFRKRDDLVELLDSELSVASEITGVLRDMTEGCRTSRDSLLDYVEQKGKGMEDMYTSSGRIREGLESLAKGENVEGVSEIRKRIQKKDLEGELRRSSLRYAISGVQINDSSVLVDWLTDASDKFLTATSVVEDQVDHLRRNGEAYKSMINLGRASRVLKEVIKNIRENSASVYAAVERAVYEVDSIFKELKFPRLHSNSRVTRMLGT